MRWRLAHAIDPVSASRHLERQHELNLHPVVSITRGSRDPHLYDRMVAAGIPPAYPRPKPPSKGRIVLSLAATAHTSVMLSVGTLIAFAAATAR